MNLTDLDVDESRPTKMSFNVPWVPQKSLFNFKHFVLVLLILLLERDTKGDYVPQFGILWDTVVVTIKICAGFDDLGPTGAGFANTKDFAHVDWPMILCNT